MALAPRVMTAADVNAALGAGTRADQLAFQEAISSASRETIAVGLLGQSNERGNVLAADRSAYPQAFASLRNPAVQMPIGPSVTPNGGWLPKLYDDMYDWGYDLQIVNGAIGSLSFINHVAGISSSRQNNTAYYKQRAPNPLNLNDRGDRGDVINVSNRMFRCTEGRTRQVLNSGPNRDLSGTYTDLDFVVFQGSQATAATAPDFFTAVNVGDTVVDGSITWTLQSTTSWFTSAPPSIGNGSFASHEGRLFDPLSLCRRLHEEMQRVKARRKIIYLCNGQSDANAGATTWYRDALIGVAMYFLRLGYEVMIGLTNYSPSSGSTAQYDGLVTQRAAALTTLQADATYGSKVFAGANLYALMGSTGPMASGGAYLQADNVHLNGAGAIAAGGHVAGSFKAILPQKYPVA